MFAVNKLGDVSNCLGNIKGNMLLALTRIGGGCFAGQ